MRCSSVIRARRRWTLPRCGSCSPASAMPLRCARLTRRSSASPAEPQYNTATRGLFRDLLRHLDRAWAEHSGADPFAGDVWQVELLGLHANASRRWPATQGVIDFEMIEPPWLREIVKDWARTTRPYLQRLRETLRACQAASHALVTAGRTDPATLGAGDFTRIIDAISAQRRADGTLYSASHRNLLLYQFCQVIEHGRGSGLMAAVPDQFRPAHRHRVRDEPNEDELGKALPDTVIRQLDARLDAARPGRPGRVAHRHRPATDAPHHLSDPAGHRSAPRRSGQPPRRLRRDHRRPAQSHLRQPQGRDGCVDGCRSPPRPPNSC